MFSILPVPGNHWEERSLPWVIPWMPVVGGVIGLVWYAATVAVQSVPIAMQTAVVVLTPLLLTGFLHLDGLMDTADAVFSRRELTEKRRILKDSHVGAFAVIALVCVLLVQCCAAVTILTTAILTEGKSFLALLFIPVVSRCAVGALMLKLPPMSTTGFAATLQKNTGPRHLACLLVLFVLCFTLPLPLGGERLLPVLVVESLVAVMMMIYLRRQFDGISGDLCGCAITLSELSALTTLALL